jgi:hypothetical protein
MGLPLGGVSIRAAGKSRVGLNSDILVLMIRRVGLTILTRWFPSLLLAPLRRGFLAAQRLRYLGGPWAIPLKSHLAPIGHLGRPSALLTAMLRGLTTIDP